MPTRGFNFDTLPTCDSHRYCAVTHLSTFRYSNKENVKSKTPNGSKHSQILNMKNIPKNLKNYRKLNPKTISNIGPNHNNKTQILHQNLNPKNFKKKSQPNPQQNPNLTTKLKSKKIIANQSPHQKPQPPPTANRSISKVTPADSVDSNPDLKAFAPRSS